MKFKLKASILLVCLLSVCSVLKIDTTYAESMNRTSNSNINALNVGYFHSEINSILNSYFESRFNFQNNISNTNKALTLIDPSKSIYEKVKITDDGLRALFINSNQKIDNYHIKTIINKIKNNNEFYEVNVTYKIDFHYSGENINSRIEENHIIHLKKINDSFIIIADIFDDDNLDSINNEYINNENRYEHNQKDEINEIKNNSISMLKTLKNNNEFNKTMSSDLNTYNYKSSNTYNREGAKGWALRNAETLKNDFNADCTNFVSKAMKYGGGMKEDNIWYYHSNAWIRVVELRNWLVNKGYAQERDNYKYAYLGDIIQYKNKSNQWKHSVIVTDRFNSYPYVRVSAHSNNRINVNVSGLYYPKGEFKSYRVLHITR